MNIYKQIFRDFHLLPRIYTCSSSNIIVRDLSDYGYICKYRNLIWGQYTGRKVCLRWALIYHRISFSFIIWQIMLIKLSKHVHYGVWDFIKVSINGVFADVMSHFFKPHHKMNKNIILHIFHFYAVSLLQTLLALRKLSTWQ